MNKVGRVVKVDEDGDIRVDFNGPQFMYAPACCIRVDRGIVDTLSPAASKEDAVSETRSAAGDAEGRLRAFC